MKDHKYERHVGDDVIWPRPGRYIAPAPIRTKPTLWRRICRLFGSKS